MRILVQETPYASQGKAARKTTLSCPEIDPSPVRTSDSSQISTTALFITTVPHQPRILRVSSQTTVECTGGQIYSIKLRECTNITEVESCLPGIYCHSDLEVGRLIDDNSIYYVCHTDAAYPGDLSPSFYACPAQQLFNPAVFACVSTISNITWTALPSPIVF
uniref:Chitin-binding type-2 domain-containing protein n=1 Tax=Lygus hesperus TaxID=30085 RepID=A0A0K8SQC1_LYGHE